MPIYLYYKHESSFIHIDDRKLPAEFDVVTTLDGEIYHLKVEDGKLFHQGHEPGSWFETPQTGWIRSFVIPERVKAPKRDPLADEDDNDYHTEMAEEAKAKEEEDGEEDQQPNAKKPKA